MAVTIIQKPEYQALRKSPVWPVVAARVKAWADGHWSLNRLLSYLDGMVSVKDGDPDVTKDLKSLCTGLRSGTKESRQALAMRFSQVDLTNT